MDSYDPRIMIPKNISRNPEDFTYFVHVRLKTSLPIYCIQLEYRDPVNVKSRNVQLGHNGEYKDYAVSKIFNQD